MFKKKVGRPSNAYKRRVRNLKLLGVAAIVTLLGTTIYSLNGYIKDNSGRLGASVTWIYGQYRYACPDGYSRYGNTQCYARSTPATASYETGVCQLEGYTWSDSGYCYKTVGKATCAHGALVDGSWCKGSYVDCEKNGGTKYGSGAFAYCNYGAPTRCNALETNSDGNGNCIAKSYNYTKKTVYSCPYDATYGFATFQGYPIPVCIYGIHDAIYTYEYTSKSKSKCMDACNNNEKIKSNITAINSCVSSCTSSCDSSSDVASCAEAYKSKEIKVDTSTGDESNYGENGTTDSSGATNIRGYYDENGNYIITENGSEAKPKELPELKITNSKNENLTNTERKRDLCTNTPLYINGATTSEVTWKSDKLKITNSVEKTSTDKVIISPKSKIKKGDKVEVTVTRTEDNKEAKVTFVNYVDCDSYTYCKKLEKININHGMTIMNGRTIKLQKDGYLGLNLEVYPLNINYKAKDIKWTTSDKKIVEIKDVTGVSNQGIQIYGKKISDKTVTITATLGDKKQTFKVKVVKEKGYNNPGGYDNASKIVSCTPKTDISKAKIDKVKTQTYTGKVIEPKVKVTYNKKTLKEGKDYKLSYSNNVNAGTANLKVKGINSYTGSLKTTFKIKKSKEDAAKTPANIKVTSKNRNLSDAGCYENALEFTFTDKNNYGIAEVYYSKDKGNKWIVLSNDAKKIDGSNAKITISKAHESIMFKVKDKKGKMSKVFGPYKVNIKNNCGKTSNSIVITKKQAEKDKFSYTIEDKSGATITQMYYYYANGKSWNKYSEFKPSKKVDNSCTIDLCYHKYINSKGIEKIYEITKTSIKEVQMKNMSKATINSVGTQAYTGKEVQPTIVVKYEGKTLTKDKDYTVKYSNNVNSGTATATVTGIALYKGSKNVNFKIVKVTKKTTNTEGAAKIQIINKNRQLSDASCYTSDKPLKFTFKELTGDGIYEVQYKTDQKPNWNTLEWGNNKTEVNITVKNYHEKIWFKVIDVNKNTKTFGAYKTNIKSNCNTTNNGSTNNQQQNTTGEASIEVINRNRTLQDASCYTTESPLKFTFKETTGVGIKEVQYKTDTIANWTRLVAGNNRTEVPITIKKYHEKIWFKVIDKNNRTKEYGPYKTNIKSSCNTTNNGSTNNTTNNTQQQTTPSGTSTGLTPTTTMKIINQVVPLSSGKKVKNQFTFTIQETSGDKITKVEYSTNGQDFIPLGSTNLSGLNTSKVNVTLRKSYSSIYFQATTSKGKYQIFGKNPKYKINIEK